MVKIKAVPCTRYLAPVIPTFGIFLKVLVTGTGLPAPCTQVPQTQPKLLPVMIPLLLASACTIQNLEIILGLIFGF